MLSAGPSRTDRPVNGNSWRAGGRAGGRSPVYDLSTFEHWDRLRRGMGASEVSFPLRRGKGELIPQFISATQANKTRRSSGDASHAGRSPSELSLVKREGDAYRVAISRGSPIGPIGPIGVRMPPACPATLVGNFSPPGRARERPPDPLSSGMSPNSGVGRQRAHVRVPGITESSAFSVSHGRPRV